MDLNLETRFVGARATALLTESATFTTPNMAWDAMLKKTGVRLELVTDYDMYLMMEQALRGGIAKAQENTAIGRLPASLGLPPRN